MEIHIEDGCSFPINVSRTHERPAQQVHRELGEGALSFPLGCSVPLIDWELMKRQKDFANLRRRVAAKSVAGVADGGAATAPAVLPAAAAAAAAAAAVVAAAETEVRSATAAASTAHAAADELIRAADLRTDRAEEALRLAREDRDALGGTGAGTTAGGPASRAAASVTELGLASEAAVVAARTFKAASKAVQVANVKLGSSIAKATSQLKKKGKKGTQVGKKGKEGLQTAIAAAKEAAVVPMLATAGRARRVESYRTRGLGDLGCGDSLMKYPAPVCVQANREDLAKKAGATTAANARKAAAESFGYALGKLLALTTKHGVSEPEHVLPPPPIKPAKVICRSHACCSPTRISRVLLTPSPTCPLVHAFLTRARVSAANYKWDAVTELSSFISCTLGLVMYGIRKLDGSIRLCPVAYLHISLLYVFEALEAGKVKIAELRALKATTWTRTGKPSTGAISGGDLFVDDQVVFFHTDENGEIVGAFAAIILWRCIYIPDADAEPESE